MQKQHCLTNYKRGIKDAHGYSMSTGHARYKLDEVLEWFESYEEEVDRIAAAVVNPEKRWYLLNCTMEDKAIWLRQILKGYAYRFGATIIPAFEAACRDHTQSQYFHQSRQKVLEIAAHEVANLEHCLVLIKGDIRAEYRRMRAGRSEVKRVLANSRDAVKQIIALIP